MDFKYTHVAKHENIFFQTAAVQNNLNKRERTSPHRSFVRFKRDPNYTRHPRKMFANTSFNCPFSSCKISDSAQQLALGVQGLKNPHFQNMCLDGESTGEVSSSCEISSSLPPPARFCKMSKKSNDFNSFNDSNSRSATLQNKRAVRQALGSVIVRDESATWSSSAEVRQTSATFVSRLVLASYFDSPHIY